MIENDRSGRLSDSILVYSDEAYTPPEDLNTSNRVVVYGSRLSGACELAVGFNDYLIERAIPEPTVEVCRDAQYITDAFYDRQPVIHESTKLNPQIPASKRGLANLMIHVKSLLKRSSPDGRGISIPVEPSQDIPASTLPKGVVVLPEMRQYTPDGQGMTINAPYEYIRQLCEKHGVPIVRLEKIDAEEITALQLSEGIMDVLVQKK